MSGYPGLVLSVQATEARVRDRSSAICWHFRGSTNLGGMIVKFSIHTSEYSTQLALLHQIDIPCQDMCISVGSVCNRAPDNAVSRFGFTVHQPQERQT